MRALAFAVFLGGACLAASVASANLEMSPISESESRVDFSRTSLSPSAWSVLERARYGEVVVLDKGHVTLLYSESERLAFRDSDRVDFDKWFNRLDFGGMPADARGSTQEAKLFGGPTTYTYVASAERTCIAFRVGVGRIVLYNRGYPGHEALLLGVLCDAGAGAEVEQALRSEAGNITIRH